MSEVVGQTLGNYRIVSEIGKGGMGVVYLAEHSLLGKKAAVKLLRADVPEDQVQRFFNEAKAAATLQHPGLVDVVDFGHAKDGRAFIVMEYLSGESLAERLERDPRLPVPIACTIARHVANALSIAHREGIVHRDLKPGNIFLLPDPESPAGVRTKVLDFGIAKLERNRDDKNVTHSGAVIGTPRYMSPEQCKNAREVDGRADIYSLGCILYEMLLGVAPFDYDSWAELVSAHLKETPPKPSELDPAIPKDVETLMLKMLSKKPQDRHRSMEELAQSIEVILREHASDWPVRATPVGGVRRIQSKQHLDETLPASSDRLTPVNLKRGTDDTLPPTPPPGTLAKDATAPGSTAPQRPTPQPDPTPVPAAAPAKKVPWLAIALGAGGTLALVGAVVLVLANKSSKQPDEPTYVVVKENETGSSKQDGSAAVETPPVTPDAAVATTTTVDAGVKAPRPTGTDVGALTRTFGTKTSAVTACFREHPDDAGKEDIFVRFQIDTQGKVTTAEVLPASVGNTALGTCLAGVAKSTDFGPQPKPAAFRVPIHTRQ